MAYLMGVDLGSTSIKAVVYDPLGNHISSGSVPTPLSHLDPTHPTWCVWEPDKIWESVVACIRQALSQLGSPQEVTALAVTGFGMDGLPMDKDGKPLYPLISWHCPRTIPQSEAFAKQVGAKRIFDITGKQVMAIDSIYRMIWLKENHPELLERTYKWLLIEDFVNYMLCGEYATDYSMATCTSVFRQDIRDWSDELIAEAGIPRSIFPKAMQSGQVLGQVLASAAVQTGLSPATRVVLGGHDYICGAYAVGAINDDVMLDVTGTWEMLVQASSVLNTSQAAFESGYYMEGHVAKDRYCAVGGTVSGDMTEWMRNHLSEKEAAEAEKAGASIWQEITKTVEKASPRSGCFFLPHFSGAGAPQFNPNSMGAFVGLQNSVSKADMMRAVFEGLDYQFRRMVESFAKYKLGNAQRIIATGGATRNTFWLQNKADVTGMPIEVPTVHEATPLGAAMLAGLGTGVYKNDAEAVASVRKSSVLYQPDMKLHAMYDEYYKAIYCKLQDALAEINREISVRFR